MAWCGETGPRRSGGGGGSQHHWGTQEIVCRVVCREWPQPARDRDSVPSPISTNMERFSSAKTSNLNCDESLTFLYIMKAYNVKTGRRRIAYKVYISHTQPVLFDSRMMVFFCFIFAHVRKHKTATTRIGFAQCWTFGQRVHKLATNYLRVWMRFRIDTIRKIISTQHKSYSIINTIYYT